MKRRLLQRTLLFLAAGLFFCLAAVFLLLIAQPGLAALAAAPLRRIVGNQAVAEVESAIFLLQDITIQQANDLGVLEARAPWQLLGRRSDWSLGQAPAAPPPTATATPALGADLAQDKSMPTAGPTAASLPTPAVTPTIPPLPTEANPSPTPEQWSLPAVPAFGSLEGEGFWQPYLFDADGGVVALRTFLQPDPERPHAVVAAVALDLRKVQLHYVLGSEEPSLPGGPQGDGYIAADHKQPGKLLATFNGGFMATHGEYGAMAGGFMPLPPKEQAGTVAIYRDGSVRIGVWGEDIEPSGDFAAWRQNASMVVRDGGIDERVFNGSIATWGGNLDGVIVTWRSGLGISADGKVLYYLAGPAMSMPTLARTMQAVGVYNGILLDINAYWVHFAAIQAEVDGLRAEPLFAEGMETQADRYLRQSPRDFFYITALP